MTELTHKQKNLVEQARKTFAEAKKNAPYRSEKSVRKQTSEITPVPPSR